MKSIFVLDDQQAHAMPAAEFALRLAWEHGANVIVGTEMTKVGTLGAPVQVMSGASVDPEDDYQVRTTLVDHLLFLSCNHKGFNPVVKELDISNMDADQLKSFHK